MVTKRAPDGLTEIDVGAYGIRVYFVTTQRAWDWVCDTKGYPHSMMVQTSSDAMTHCYPESHQIFVCADPKHLRTRERKIQLMVHEAVHVFQFLCDMIGEDRPG